MMHILNRHKTLGATAVASLLLISAPATADAPESSKAPQAPEVDLAEMVEYSGATFTMGTSTDEDVGRYGDRWFVNEQPDHEVTLDGFRLDKNEVTVAEFALFLTYAGGDYHYDENQPINPVENGYLPTPGAEDEPIRFVTWEAADHYCKWAGKRLPTEAEWEFAATGTENREFPWGDQGGRCDVSNYFAGASFCHQSVLPVGSLPAGNSPEGVQDLSGNVAEWVGDWYARYPDSGAAQTDPTGPESGELKVVRGGGYLSSGRWRRAKARWGAEPARRSTNIGFRCAYDSEPTDDAVRGELQAPADEGRQDRLAPLAPAAELPAVVAEGLDKPGAVVAAGGEWFVLDRGNASIVAIAPENWELRAVVDDLGEPTEMATDGVSLFVTDEGAGAVVQIDPATGDKTTLADSLTEPHGLDANAQQVAWFDGDTLHRYDIAADAVSEVLTDLVDPVALTQAGTTIFYSTRGNASETKLSYIDPTGTDGVQTLIDKDSIGLGGQMDRFYTQHAFVDAQNALWFDLRYRGFPNNSLVMCRIDLQSGSGDCPTYTPPPHGSKMTVVGQTAYFPIRNSLIRYTYDSGEPFMQVTPWTRPGGVVATTDFVLWSDEQNGRVYYQEVE